MNTVIEKDFNRMNVFEFTVSKTRFKELIDKLEKPGLTKEYFEECKEVEILFKKPSK